MESCADLNHIANAPHFFRYSRATSGGGCSFPCKAGEADQDLVGLCQARGGLLADGNGQKLSANSDISFVS